MALRVDVAVAAPLWQPLTYAVSEELAPLVRPLARLVVPLRGRRALAFALGEPRPGEMAGLKPVDDVLEDASGSGVWPAVMLRFFERAAAHYQTPLGQALAWALPAGLGSLSASGQESTRRDQQARVACFRAGPDDTCPRPETQAARMLARLEADGPLPLSLLRAQFPRASALAKKLEQDGWLRIVHQSLVRDLLGQPILPDPKPEVLSDDQDRALSTLLPKIKNREFSPHLLYGVTGSGKTEVYLRARPRPRWPPGAVC